MIVLSRWRRVELYACSALPGLATLLLAVFCLVPKHLVGFGSFMPLLTLAPMYFWGVRHSGSMPYWFVFALGILIDAGMGQAVGFTSLLNLLFLRVIYAQSKYIHKEGFIIKWGYFALLVAMNQLAGWAGLSLLGGYFMPVGAAFVQWLLTLLCYPALHRCFELLEQFIQRRRWVISHAD